MKAIFSQDLYLQAWNFASKAHGDQKLPGSDIPYINHVGNVVMEVIAAIGSIPVQFPDLAIQSALLHDVIEDTKVTYNEVKSNFGAQVADAVMSLTKNKDLPTKLEQIEDSLNRILLQPKEIWIVKLADRITNLQSPPHFWKQEKIAAYRNEAILIHKQLGDSHQLLADRLHQKIESYRKFIH